MHFLLVFWHISELVHNIGLICSLIELLRAELLVLNTYYHVVRFIPYFDVLIRHQVGFGWTGCLVRINEPFDFLWIWLFILWRSQNR